MLFTAWERSLSKMLTTSLSTEWTWGEKGAVGIVLITLQGKNEPSMKPVLDTET